MGQYPYKRILANILNSYPSELLEGLLLDFVVCVDWDPVTIVVVAGVDLAAAPAAAAVTRVGSQ